MAAARGRRRVAGRAVAAQPRRPPGRDARHRRPRAPARRFASVRHLAELFDRYALHRPEMVRAWAAGRDVDATGARLPADARWQAELWRRLRDRAGQPDPAERLEAACARLRAEPELVDLPGRLSLFGLTRLPAGHLQVLRALGARRDVHLFLLHPSPALWERVAAAPRIARRAEDVTRELPANRLLASWGQDARELQLVLAGPSLPADADHHHETTAAGGTLLGRLQADVRADRPPPGPPLPGRPDERLELADRSVQVHACHGRARQVEVLRDAILHLLAEDPTLEPRDVIVMCPDIETFAPLIGATFGAGEAARRRRARGPPGPAAPGRPARPPRRPLAAPDQPGARRRRAPARARRPAPDRLAGARPRRPRARPPPLRPRRRRPRARRGLGRAVGDPLGPGRRAPRAVQARQAARRHVARRPGPRAARRRR